MSKEVTKTQFDEVVKLIEKEQWAEAEKLLLSYKDIPDSRIDYLLGCVYDEHSNPNKDKEKAKKYFGRVIDSDKPIAAAFVYLSDIENNKAHSIRILKKGLKIFPGNEAIYFNLLERAPKEERENIYNAAIRNNAVSERIKVSMANTYFDTHEYIKVISTLEGIKRDKNYSMLILECIKGFSYYELGQIKESKEAFNYAIDEDLNHKLSYIPHIGLILDFLHGNEIAEAERIIEEVNPEFHIDPILHSFECYMLANDYIIKALNLLEKSSKQKSVLAIARGLRGIFSYNESNNGRSKTTVIKKMVKDLEFANEFFPRNKEFCQHLYWIYRDEVNASLSAWKYLKQYALSCEESEYSESSITEDIDGETFKAILKDLNQTIGSYYNRRKIAVTLLPPVIERLHKEKRYSEIIAFAKEFSDVHLETCPVLFEIAYAFNEMTDLLASQKYYEMHIKLNGESSATLNNLGLIHEQKDELYKAKECFQKAIDIDGKKERYKNNLKRIEDKLREIDKTEFELRAATENYKTESPNVQKKILDFYSQRNAEGLIICSYKHAPKYLNMSGLKAVDFLADIIKKKYILKVTDHKYDTTSNVYKLNPYLDKEIAQIEEELKAETDFLEMCNRLNTESLNVIGYNADLLKNLSKVSSNELRQMLLRDIKENAVSIILKQHKSALVLSGSIIEAVLMDRILSIGINKYSIINKIKDVIKMDLNELLEVAEKEKIIDSTMSHLAHGVRGYRNLIHPGVEARKTSIQVNEPNVELAWLVVKKVLNEIR